jgi:hypothetical protein
MEKPMTFKNSNSKRSAKFQTAIGSLSIFATLLSAPTAIAGSEIRNGGYGVTINGQLVSLDLAEAGVHSHQSLHIGKSTLSNQSLSIIERIVDDVFVGDLAQSDQMAQLIAGKLALINDMSAQINSNFDAEKMIENADRYEWVAHKEQSCLDVRDEANDRFSQRTQLAYREENYIRFCSDAFRLDQQNMSALIIHEMIYASLSVKSKTKELVGALYSPKSLLSNADDIAWYKELIQELTTHKNEFLSKKISRNEAIKLNKGCFRNSIGVCTWEVTEVNYDEFLALDTVRVITRSASGASIISEFKCSSDGVCKNKTFGGKVLRYFSIINADNVDFYTASKIVENLVRIIN